MKNRKLTVISRRSPLTGKMNEMAITLDETDLARWANDRVSIQEAMPYLTPSEREFIMTGYTEQDWDTLFGKDWNGLFGSEQ